MSILSIRVWTVDCRWWMVSLGPESSRWGGCALEMTALICATIVAVVVAAFARLFLMLVVGFEAG